VALAIEDEPFPVLFAPRLKKSPLFHATLNAELEAKQPVAKRRHVQVMFRE
jgi:hypothetical protein